MDKEYILYLWHSEFMKKKSMVSLKNEYVKCGMSEADFDQELYLAIFRDLSQERNELRKEITYKYALTELIRLIRRIKIPSGIRVSGGDRLEFLDDTGYEPPEQVYLYDKSCTINGWSGIKFTTEKEPKVKRGPGRPRKEHKID